MSELILFGREDCQLCKTARHAFDAKHIKYQYEDFDHFMSNGNSVDDKITVRAALAFVDEQFPLGINRKNGSFTLEDNWLSKDQVMAMGGVRETKCEGGVCRL